MQCAKNNRGRNFVKISVAYTYNSSAFHDRERPTGQHDIYFNGPGDGGDHGHVVTNPDGSYEYVRDVEGNVYIDNNQK